MQLEQLQRLTEFDRQAPGLTFEKLPFVQAPSGNELIPYGQLHALLTQWVQAGSAVPITIGQLTGFVPEVVAVLKKLLGNLWHAWLNTSEPEPEAVLPAQMVHFAYRALERIRVDIESAGCDSQLAAKTYTRIAEEHAKRRRVSAADADAGGTDERA